MDESIIQAIKKKYNLLVGERTSEEIKIEIGSAYPMEENKQLEVKGRDLVSGIPKTIVINEEEIRDALDEPISQIVEGVKAALENTPPELSADIVDKGIVLAGGGALLRGLDILLREETNLPITIADDPLSTIVLGAGQALNEIELLKQISIR
jgi:rod shape-determining protein MreB